MNVQRAANNYALQKSMRSGARNEAYNFITDSGKIDGASTATDTNFVKTPTYVTQRRSNSQVSHKLRKLKATQNANENAKAKPTKLNLMSSNNRWKRKERETKLNLVLLTSLANRKRHLVWSLLIGYLPTAKGYEPQHYVLS